MKLLLALLLLVPQVSFGMSLAVTQAVASRQVIYEEAIRALGPVAYWRLGEGSGTTAASDTGVHNGTYTNTPTLGVDGLLTDNGDTAITTASASDERVAVSDHADLRFTSAVTIMGWCNTSSALMQDLYAGFEEVSFFDGFELRVNSTTSEPQFIACDNVSACKAVTGTSDATDGNTHFLVGTFTDAGSGTCEIFFDGTSEGTAQCDAPAGVAFPGGVCLGARCSAVLDFNGTLDEIAVWNMVLSDGQIQMLWYLGSGRQVSPGDSW